MDPTHAWLMMLASWRESDWECLVEHAESLLDWLDKGGFPPKLNYDAPTSDELNKTLVRAVCMLGRSLGDAMLMSKAGLPTHLPFRLRCRECNVEGPECFYRAERDGWTHVEFDPHALETHFTATCPNCRPA